MVMRSDDKLYAIARKQIASPPTPGAMVAEHPHLRQLAHAGDRPGFGSSMSQALQPKRRLEGVVG